MTKKLRDLNQANAVPRRTILQHFSAAAVCGIGYTATHAADRESKFRMAQNGDSDEQAVFVSAINRANKGKEKILEQELLSLSPKVCSEPGCRFYDLYRGIEQPNIFMRFEEWS